MEFSGAQPPKDDILAQLQELVSKKVKDNAPVVLEEFDRAEAEQKYRKDNVNGQFIYERRHPPESIVW